VSDETPEGPVPTDSDEDPVPAEGKEDSVQSEDANDPPAEEMAEDPAEGGSEQDRDASASAEDLVPTDGTREITGFVTYAGGGFATVRRAPERGEDPDPQPASNRRYLRDGLPAVYREQDFTMRFLEALEEVLDQTVAVMDSLAAHFEPDLAPPDVLELTTAWLGIRHNQSQDPGELRALVQKATELGRLRGTRAGLELALTLNFPTLPLRIEDGGGVRFSSDGGLPDPRAPSFVVFCDKAIPKAQAASVARVIEAVKPAHVGYRLRTKRPKERKGAQEASPT
jgi:phage tail-like protein